MAERVGSIERLETEALAWTEKRDDKFQYFSANILQGALQTRASRTVSIANVTTCLLRFDIVASFSISGRKFVFFHKLFEVLDCLHQSLF